MPPITLRDVRRAIAGAELELAFQPEVDLRTGHIAAVEALVRWRHPELGLVPPAQFIPLAERSGQMREITNVVIHQALQQATRWAGARWDRQPLPIWVNLSACELSDPQLDRRVAALLDQYGVAPSQLGIEVTESAPIADRKLALSTLYTFRDLGIRLAIDDFGTGYSSLSHIKDLPVDIVKIDRRFVEGVAHETADAAIVTAVVTMAHALRRVVVAEGVEDIEQQNALNALGCDLGQGYLYSSPQPARCIDVLLDADRELASAPNLARALPVRLPRPRLAEQPWPLGRSIQI